MANELWGPLAGLIGNWESGYDGLDVSFHNDSGKIGETPFRERTSFVPFDRSKMASEHCSDSITAPASGERATRAPFTPRWATGCGTPRTSR
jgi:hypothetical protein